MAHAHNIASNVGIFDRIFAFAASAKTAWALRKAYNETYEELNSLSDRELSDIAISRSDIPYIARVHVYGH